MIGVDSEPHVFLSFLLRNHVSSPAVIRFVSARKSDMMIKCSRAKCQNATKIQFSSQFKYRILILGVLELQNWKQINGHIQTYITARLIQDFKNKATRWRGENLTFQQKEIHDSRFDPAELPSTNIIPLITLFLSTRLAKRPVALCSSQINFAQRSIWVKSKGTETKQCKELMPVECCCTELELGN